MSTRALLIDQNQKITDLCKRVLHRLGYRDLFVSDWDHLVSQLSLQKWELLILFLEEENILEAKKTASWSYTIQNLDPTTRILWIAEVSSRKQLLTLESMGCYQPLLIPLYEKSLEKHLLNLLKTEDLSDLEELRIVSKVRILMEDSLEKAWLKLRDFLGNYPKCISLHEIKAEILFQKKDYVLAQSALLHILEMEPQRSSAIRLLRDVEKTLEKISNDQMSEREKQKKISQIKEKNQKASSLLKKGRIKESLKLYEELVKQASYTHVHGQVIYNAARAYFQGEMWDRAEELCQLALDVSSIHHENLIILMNQIHEKKKQELENIQKTEISQVPLLKEKPPQEDGFITNMDIDISQTLENINIQDSRAWYILSWEKSVNRRNEIAKGAKRETFMISPHEKVIEYLMFVRKRY